MSRASVEDIKKAHAELIHGGLTLKRLRDSAISGRLFSGSVDESAQVPGRSIAWKLFLLHSEPLSTAIESTFLLDALVQSRKQYAQSLVDKMRAPDGSFEDGFTLPGTSQAPERTTKLEGDLDRNNPLSLDDQNPWTEWFAAVELRKVILQDVERTFPELEFFRNQDVQTQLTYILFLYSSSHPTIGYRQGMHELLAPLFYAVYYDSIFDQPTTPSSSVSDICAESWIAADSWALFDAIMNAGASTYYEWQEPSNIAGTSSGKVQLKPYISPIVQACNQIQDLLRIADPLLWKRMQASGVEPQIYGIKWLRLLFTREFTLTESMKLWDGLFASGPNFDLALWVCVAMLIRIRNDLIPSDYTGQLTSLLRYPSAGASITLLLTQAIRLQSSPSHATGLGVIHENSSLLGIPTEIPERSPPPVRRRPLPDGRRSLDNSQQPGTLAHRRQQQSASSYPEMLARNILERGESFGINKKTVMNAVSELRRNIPASFARSPPSTPGTIPLSGDRVIEGPIWSPVQDNMNERLGHSLSWVLESLEDEAKKKAAMEALAYVRDVLVGKEKQIDEERLMDEDLWKRETTTNRTRERSLSISGSSPSSHPDASLESATAQMSKSTILPAADSKTRIGTSSTRRAQNESWSYTKSEFAGSRHGLPSTALPRHPPSSRPAAPVDPLRPPKEPSTEATTRPRIEKAASPSVVHDPLGVT